MRNHVQSVVFVFFLLLAQHTDGQYRPLDVFRTTSPDTPQRFGDGILEHIIRGDNLLSRGQTEQAILAYDNAIAQDPYFAEGYIKRALAKYRTGRITEAQLDYHTALKMNPYAADLYGYGNHMRKLKILAFDPSNIKTPPGTPSEDVLAYLIRGISKKMEGNILGALTDIEKAMSLTPFRDAVLYKIRGNLMFLLGKYPEAIEDYSTAIELVPDFAEAYFNRGLARILDFNRGDACYDLERSLELGYEPGKNKISYFCSF